MKTGQCSGTGPAPPHCTRAGSKRGVMTASEDYLSTGRRRPHAAVAQTLACGSQCSLSLPTVKIVLHLGLLFFHSK
ncbi:hypothetical protein EVAR_75852_1 [Eumeta japonica]|uniref:Uncharacterized protein n=1 Tax=Eumeta variegata TaxID=151549 RepID=A0A4C1TGL1_EUMVA|nr:hypothetical protein EVAR_75852_1 [Eumeta japonica]